MKVIKTELFYCDIDAEEVIFLFVYSENFAQKNIGFFKYIFNYIIILDSLYLIILIILSIFRQFIEII